MGDRRERYFEPAETLHMAMDWQQSQIWTALPGIVVRYPGTAGGNLTVDVQSTIMGIRTDIKTGKNSPVQMPLFQDCPLLFQGGGGATLTFPVKAGDEALVVFAARAIDNWWKAGGIQPPNELRMHNLSDGFALVGVRSLPHSFVLDTSNVALITDDGTTYFKMNPTSKAMTIAAASLTINTTGSVNINGAVISHAGEVTDALGKVLGTHTHSDPQGGTTGGPT